MASKTSLKIKLIISISSFLFFAFLLEIILRGIGYFYVLNNNPAVPKNTSGQYIILCIGDSFTFGGNVPRENSYPAQLAEIIEEKNLKGKISVINKGMCELNSRQLLKLLPGWVNSCRPNLIILLVGSANKFNITGYELNDGKYNAPLILMNMFRNLRIFKMARLIALNFKWKTIYYWDIKYLSDVRPIWTILDKNAQGRNYFEKMGKVESFSKKSAFLNIWFYYNTGQAQKALELCRELIPINSDPSMALCAAAYIYYKQGKYDIAEQYFKKALLKRPSSELVLCQLVFFYRKVANEYVRLGRLDMAVEYYLKEIEINPVELPPYYLLSKAYELQSKYGSNFIVKFFHKMVSANPSLGKNNLFMDYLVLFENKQGWEEKINDWLRVELTEIVQLSRKNNIKLIFQNYPVSYPLANKALRDISTNYSLPLVDNFFVFGKLIGKGPRGAYISDDDHCSPLGYKVMAENVYNTLLLEGIVADSRRAIPAPKYKDGTK